LAASDAFEALSLDRLLFVPAFSQPLKQARSGADPRQRLEMVRRLIGDDSRFSVDEIEIDRAGLSYTVDTLAAFAERWPGATRFFLAGADVLGAFAQWREPERIRQLATLVLLQRSEGDRSTPVDAHWMKLATRRIDISSTEIRERVHAGRSIRGFVPAAVADFITAERLYR
jgi:nicotinate-nucleotide adenylyltransferase